MNFKVAMIASALMAFAGIFTVGCGGNECDKASDAVAACSSGSTGDTGSSEEVECTGAVECNAKCINAQSDQICDIIGGKADADTLKTFTDCVAACSSTM